ncbi:MAG: hypothetical protein WC263_04310 [Candidatus Micrarchaeia archaeon]|jgi:hypothetical protein
MDDDGKEIHSLVLEKRRIEEKLTRAGGSDFHFLLQDCADLSDIIDEIEDVSGQMHEKEHAAFEAKIKFSRKIRRKAKDMKNFEQHLVSEYESKHITLEHGKRMVSIIKLLRSKSTDKARREASEFYEFIEMGARLEIVNDLLLKKRAQLERARRDVEAKLAGIEWLAKEPSIDDEKVKRHDEKAQINEQLSKIWQAHVQSLKSMPLCALLLKMKEGELGRIGFPEISAQEAGALASFLQKSKLEAKTAQELHEMAGESEQKLRHLGIDLSLFRQEVAARRGFFFSIMSFSRAPDINYLSAHDDGAQRLVGRLSELGKTKEADEAEWQRAEKAGQKRAELAGSDKAALEKQLQELRALEDVLDGKAEPAKAEESGKGEGIFGSFLKLLGGK